MKAGVPTDSSSGGGGGTVRDCETERPASIPSVTTQTFEFTFHDKHKYPRSNVRAGLVGNIDSTNLYNTSVVL